MKIIQAPVSNVKQFLPYPQHKFIPGGGVRNCGCQVFFAPICQNFREFARVLPPFALFCHTRRDLSTDLFAPIVQKVLDIVDALLYNRRRAFKINAQLPQKVLDNPGSCAYTTRVGTGSSSKTMPFGKNFALTRKKDLTIVALLLIMARGKRCENRR